MKRLSDRSSQIDLLKSAFSRFPHAHTPTSLLLPGVSLQSFLSCFLLPPPPTTIQTSTLLIGSRSFIHYIIIMNHDRINIIHLCRYVRKTTFDYYTITTPHDRHKQLIFYCVLWIYNLLTTRLRLLLVLLFHDETNNSVFYQKKMHRFQQQILTCFYSTYFILLSSPSSSHFLRRVDEK